VAPKNDDLKIHIGIERDIVDFCPCVPDIRLVMTKRIWPSGRLRKVDWLVDYPLCVQVGAWLQHRLALTMQLK